MHPLTRDRLGWGITRWVKWQIGSRLVPGPVVVTLAGDAKILVSAGMHGATMNVFTGLADFEEMGFMLHLLRPDDLFADVGANVGVFGVLAGAAVGCRVVLFEPGEKAFANLQTNLRLNALGERAVARRMVVAESPGEVSFTATLDTLNHVAAVGESGIRLTATTLDQEFPSDVPRLLKIDVEGFEASVLAGATKMLGHPALEAVIMELGAHSFRYGIDPRDTFRLMTSRGFVPVDYNPLNRSINLAPDHLDPGKSDTIFVRETCLAAIGEQLRTAPRYGVLGREL